MSCQLLVMAVVSAICMSGAYSQAPSALIIPPGSVIIPIQVPDWCFFQNQTANLSRQMTATGQRTFTKINQIIQSSLATNLKPIVKSLQTAYAPVLAQLTNGLTPANVSAIGDLLCIDDSKACTSSVISCKFQTTLTNIAIAWSRENLAAFAFLYSNLLEKLPPVLDTTYRQIATTYKVDLLELRQIESPTVLSAIRELYQVGNITLVP